MNIRKSLLILVIPILLMALSSLGGLAYLAEAHPYGPGHPLYVTQETAQQWEMLLASDPAYRAACALEIAECRLTDLAYASTPAEIDQMLIGLDQALQQANECLAAAPESARATMQTRLAQLCQQAELVLASLSPAGANSTTQQLLANLEQRLADLQPAPGVLFPATATKDTAAALLGIEIPVAFLQADVDHGQFPMGGSHNTDCLACHTSGEYAGQATDCLACHRLPAGTPYPDHFAGDCLDCHNLDTWAPTQFAHEGVTECLSCHKAATPARHYPTLSECRVCHTSLVTWTEVSFGHVGLSECRSCHAADSPAGHYPGP